MNHPYMPETGIAIRLAPLAEPRGPKKGNREWLEKRTSTVNDTLGTETVSTYVWLVTARIDPAKKQTAWTFDRQTPRGG